MLPFVFGDATDGVLDTGSVLPCTVMLSGVVLDPPARVSAWPIVVNVTKQNKP